MAGKKKTAPEAGTLVAKVAILIEGKHFDAGAPIEGVSEEELRRAVNAKRVVSSTSDEGKAVLAALATRRAAKEEAERLAKEEAERLAKEEAERAAKEAGAGNGGSSTDAQPQA